MAYIIITSLKRNFASWVTYLIHYWLTYFIQAPAQTLLSKFVGLKYHK